MAWLERCQLPIEPQPPPPDVNLALRGWNMLGGMEWSGLEMVADLLGVEDVEIFVIQLAALRDNREKFHA